ncbi:MAG: hypothetical protein HQ485_10280 [Acidobacteria bacterium]|jgi:cytochrome c556|nr:hypothetical protein [Acidobacteriota bacterium]
MERRRLIQIRRSTLFAVGACAMMAMMAAVAVRAQRGGGAPAAPPPVPLSASSLLLHPDLYVGQTVALYGAVEDSLSATTFSLDQDATKASLEQVFVIAPTLATPPTPGTYVTVVGVALRFEPTELQRHAADYTLDVSPTVSQRFRGKAIILATAVIDPSMTDLAKVVPAPLTPEEASFDRIMKQVNPIAAEVRQGVAAADLELVRTQAATLKELFDETRQLFEARKADDAVAWATEGVALAAAIEKGATSNSWADAREASAKLAPLCQACHAAYRVRQEDGTYRVKGNSGR